MHLYIKIREGRSHSEQDTNEFLLRSLKGYSDTCRRTSSQAPDTSLRAQRGNPADGGSLSVTPQDLAALIRRGEYGKPYFTGTLADISFSLSHSGRYIAVLYADLRQGEVGLDIEDVGRGMDGGARNRDPVRLMKIAERFFTREETEWVRESPEDLPDRFFKIWTGKESYIKYTGRGLGQGLDTFSVLSPPEGVLIEEVRLPAEVVPGLVCSRCCSLRGGEKGAKIVIYE
jgi:hypothetical protein